MESVESRTPSSERYNTVEVKSIVSLPDDAIQRIIQHGLWEKLRKDAEGGLRPFVTREHTRLLVLQNICRGMQKKKVNILRGLHLWRDKFPKAGRVAVEKVVFNVEKQKLEKYLDFKLPIYKTIACPRPHLLLPDHDGPIDGVNLKNWNRVKLAEKKEDLQQYFELPQHKNTIKELTIEKYREDSIDKDVLLSFFEKMPYCKTLDLRGCETLEVLPGEMPVLQELQINECNSLLSFPDEITGLASLTRLILSGCRALVSLPKHIEKCKSLTFLSLFDCNSLVSLPEGLEECKSLTDLKLNYCTSLESLPAQIGNLTSLKTLSLRDCHKLRSLPDSIGGLTSLIGLDLSACNALQALPESITNLTSLTYISVTRCPELVSLPRGFENLVNLDKENFMQAIKSVRLLPESIVHHPYLQDMTELDLNNARVESLPNSIGNLQSLKTLGLYGCKDLKSLPESIGNLEGLTTLNLFYCHALTSLPESIGNLKSLTTLKLMYCKNLESLPRRFSELTNLEFLALEGCDSLQSLPQGLQNLNLKTLLVPRHIANDSEKFPRDLRQALKSKGCTYDYFTNFMGSW